MKNNEERTTKTVEKNGLIISEDGKSLTGLRLLARKLSMIAVFSGKFPCLRVSGK